MQKRGLQSGADVVISTPGRLLSHINLYNIDFSGVKYFILDEADRMLDMGFIPDIEEICKKLPFTRQTLFFSATMPPEIQRLTEAFLSNPVKIEVARPASTASTITQRLVASGAEAHTKRDVLRGLIRNAQDLQNAIIFCNRKRDVAILHRSLEKHGFNVTALHGDMDQRSRMQALDNFRNGSVTLLVASDVAARGLDIPEVSHVFNYDVPFHPDDYVHRIGRTGRAGRTGSAISLVTTQDVKALAAIESLTGKPIEWDGPTLDALIAQQPDLDHPESRRARPSRSEGRDRKERREDRPDRRHVRGPETRPQEARQDAKSDETRGASRPAREPIRHQPIRAGDRPLHGRMRQDEELPVIGFGDHIPAFLLQKVVLGPPSDNFEVDEGDDTGVQVIEDVVAQEAVDEAQEHVSTPARKRSRKKRTIAIATPADSGIEAAQETNLEETGADLDPQAPAATTAELEITVVPEVTALPETADLAAVETQDAEPVAAAEVPTSAPVVSETTAATAPEEPSRAKPVRRTRRKVAEPAPQAEEPVAKPVRKRAIRKTKDDAAAAAIPTPADAEATPVEVATVAPISADIDAVATTVTGDAQPVKPKRTRRAKPAAEPASTPEPAPKTSDDQPAAEKAAAAPARKRPSRKKVEAVAETETVQEKPAPRRSRRKVATASAETGQEAGDLAHAKNSSAENLSLADAHSSDA